jgi:hypothetical protein
MYRANKETTMTNEYVAERVKRLLANEIEDNETEMEMLTVQPDGSLKVYGFTGEAVTITFK